jgi:hypothetical protein
VAVERRNPLPVGRYWIDLFGDKRQVFTDWQRQNRDTVKVRETEDHPDESPPHTFFIFEVLGPDASGQLGAPHFPDELGFPNIATADIQSEQDTVSKPDVEQPSGQAIATGSIVFGALLLWALFESSKKGKRPLFGSSRSSRRELAVF